MQRNINNSNRNDKNGYDGGDDNLIMKYFCNVTGTKKKGDGKCFCHDKDSRKLLVIV